MRKKSVGAKNEEITAARARAAGRMRRSRNRRAKEMRCYTLELRDEEIAALVRRGLLSPEGQTDRAAVLKAMYAFLDRTIAETAYHQRKRDAANGKRQVPLYIADLAA
jgi:hypothetical protein